MQKGFALPLVLAPLLLISLLAATVYYYYQSKPNLSQTNPIPQPSAQIQKDETSNGKTYTNSEYKYSFRYSPEYGEPQVVLDNQSPKFLNIWLKRQNPYLELGVISYIDGNRSSDCNELLNSSSHKEVTIAGVKGCQVKRNDSTYSYQALVKKGDYSLSITMTALEEATLKDNEKMFDQFLSTFKFLDDETANWKTYENKTYGYSFKYPTENIIREDGQTTMVDFPPEIQGVSWPIFYVNVIHILGDNDISYNNDGFTKNADKYLANTKLGENVKPPDQPFHAEFTYIKDTSVDGLKASMFEGISGDKRVLLFRENQVIMLGGYSSNPESVKKFENFISTFKLLK